MSIESVAIALHHSQASGTAKLVLIGIANHDGDAGSFPKTATLAKYANVHPRRVTEAVAKLVELKEIVVHAKEGGMRSLRDELRPNVYEMVLACPPNCDRTKAHNLLDEHGKPLHFGRSYKGPYDPARGKRAPRLAAVDNSQADTQEDAPAPSDENSARDGNSASPSDGNSASPSDGNSATKNHPRKHQGNPALVPTSPGNRAAVENLPWNKPGGDTLRDIVPALPRVAAPGHDATNGKTDPLGLTDEQKSRNRSGAAMARAALRGQLAGKEAGDVA